ncbi:MAG TPA: ABC transporter ATP-binding protein [Beijerinckiaceae bacterium]|jgi:NitT/TauT family transport system ATP-binding protein
MRLLVEEVSHDFNGLSVLEDVSFEVAGNEVVVVIGPSGCGKSTLLSIIGGLLRPAKGAVEIEGEPPKNSLNPITFVFQDFALLPWRTVRDNVAFGLEHHGLSRREIDALVQDALARTGLSDFADVVPKKLSGGMRQRVGIARALAVSPAVCLMDEPLSALDAQTRELLLEDFRRIWAEERVATIYITHNLDEAVRLADRVVVLSRQPGRIKDVIAIPIPRAERGAEAAAAELAMLHNRLWRLIRDEAIAADRELAG